MLRFSLVIRCKYTGSHKKTQEPGAPRCTFYIDGRGELKLGLQWIMSNGGSAGLDGEIMSKLGAAGWCPDRWCHFNVTFAGQPRGEGSLLSGTYRHLSNALTRKVFSIFVLQICLQRPRKSKSESNFLALEVKQTGCLLLLLLLLVVVCCLLFMSSAFCAKICIEPHNQF